MERYRADTGRTTPPDTEYVGTHLHLDLPRRVGDWLRDELRRAPVSEVLLAGARSTWRFDTAVPDTTPDSLADQFDVTLYTDDDRLTAVGPRSAVDEA